MKKKKISHTKFYKYFIAVFLLSVLVVITVNFISRSKKRIKITPSKGEIVKQKVDNKENVLYLTNSQVLENYE